MMFIVSIITSIIYGLITNVLDLEYDPMPIYKTGLLLDLFLLLVWSIV